jgi:hypothetical protein
VACILSHWCTNMYVFFWVPPDFKKMFCLGYEKRGFRSSVGPHGNQLSFFHKYEEKFVSHANACAACLIPPRTAPPDNMGCTAAHVNNSSGHGKFEVPTLISCLFFIPQDTSAQTSFSYSAVFTQHIYSRALHFPSEQSSCSAFKRNIKTSESE